MTAANGMPETWEGPVAGASQVAGGDARLTDLSRQRRLGFKGRNTGEWLSAAGLVIPTAPNRSVLVKGLLVACLSPGEFLMLATEDSGAKTISQLEAQHRQDRPARCHSVPRQDMSAWFHLSGPGALGVLGEICAVDLRPPAFDERAVAQTSVALHNCIVLRDDTGDAPGFSLVTEFSGAAYFWRVMAGKVAAGGSGPADTTGGAGKT